MKLLDALVDAINVLRIALLAANIIAATATATWLIWDGQLGILGIGLALILLTVSALAVGGFYYSIKYFKEA